MKMCVDLRTLLSLMALLATSAGNLVGVHVRQASPSLATWSSACSPHINEYSFLTARVAPIVVLGSSWELDWNEYRSFTLPIQVAAVGLEEFWLHIADYAHRAIGPGPSRFNLVYGQLELEVICSDGAVDWDTIRQFAMAMLYAVRRGNTSTFHCNVINTVADVFITFNLYFLAARVGAQGAS